MSSPLSPSDLDKKRQELLLELDQVKELAQRLTGAILLIDELRAPAPSAEAIPASPESY